MYTVHNVDKIHCFTAVCVAACIYITILLVIFTQAMLANRHRKMKMFFINKNKKFKECAKLWFINADVCILNVTAAPV